MGCRSLLPVGLLVGSIASAVAAQADESFVAFESGPVRPLALVGNPPSHLLATNTPDNRMEIFDIASGAFTHVDSVPVGLEPVAVAVRAGEAWVVNHLSDSVSIVDLTADPPYVKQTLLVGDEPRDIVFAGSPERAFITTARRGPRLGELPSAPKEQLTAEGVGRALVWVFNATSPGDAFGTPEHIIELFGDTPRALATSPDRNRVYAAVFHSGNQTTALTEGALGSQTLVARSPEDVEVGVIAKWCEPSWDNWCNQSSSGWYDESGRDLSEYVRLELPDWDVFAIDAASITDPPRQFPHVGTTLFNMVVGTRGGKDEVYVSNTESLNHVRFEGDGVWGAPYTDHKIAGIPKTLQGHIAETRITKLTNDFGTGPVQRSDVVAVHLNGHLDYELHDAPGFDSNARQASLAIPLSIVLSADGSTLYLAAFGSHKVGVFQVDDLVDDFDPTAAGPSGTPPNQAYIDLSDSSDANIGGGPAGLALEEGSRLFVLTRFDNTVWAISLSDTSQRQSHRLHNPEPPYVLAGRRFLYDANYTSANGENSCASCHVFGDMDHLAWDLGFPEGEGDIKNYNPQVLDEVPGNCANDFPWPGDSLATREHRLCLIEGIVGFDSGYDTDFSDLKGPMTTQSLRGMRGNGPLHWRGDRSAANTPPERTLDPLAEDEENFARFNGAFESLLGRDGELDPAEMEQFAEFSMALAYPPNPIQALDNPDPMETATLRELYEQRRTDSGFLSCNDCHELDSARARFGTNGRMTGEGEPQQFKIPHLRNLYQKVGMFGMPAATFLPSPVPATNTGEQVRGFGFLHDGSVDTVFNFLSASVFGNLTEAEVRELEAFVLAMPSELAPIVGQQVTIDSQNVGDPGVVSRRDLLLARAVKPAPLPGKADRTECDVVVKTAINGTARGWFYEGGSFTGDDGLVEDLTSLLNRVTAGAVLTFTATPPGEGRRAGIDRDGDGILDGHEENVDPELTLANCPDPAEPLTFGANTSTELLLSTSERWKAYVESLVVGEYEYDPNDVTPAAIPLTGEGDEPTSVTVAVGTGPDSQCTFNVQVVTRKDIQLVLDDTMSMRRPGGIWVDATDTGATQTIDVSKLEALKRVVQSITMILREQRPSSQVGDRIGLVTFKGSYLLGDAADCDAYEATQEVTLGEATPMQLSTVDSAALGMQATGTATPLRAGIEVGIAGFEAEDPEEEFTSNERRMLLVTDGRQNTEGCRIQTATNETRATLADAGIWLASYGLGLGAQLDGGLLGHISDTYQANSTIVDLHKMVFQDFATKVLDQPVHVDPRGTIRSGQPANVGFEVTSDARTLTVVASWAREESEIDLVLVSPQGTVFSSSDADVRLSKLQGQAWIAWIMRFPLGGALAGHEIGGWTARLLASSTVRAEGEPWTMLAFGETPINMEVQPLPPAVLPGRELSLRITLPHDRIRDAAVVVHIDEPQKPFGTALSEFGMSDRDVILATRSLGRNEDRDLAAARLNLFALRGKPIPAKRRTVALHDDGKHGDGRAGDGVYGERIALPKVDGTYQLTYIAKGRNQQDEAVRREHRESLHLPVRVDAKRTTVQTERTNTRPDWWTRRLQSNNPKIAAHDRSAQLHKMVVVPRDANGLKLGPGFKNAFQTNVIEWNDWRRNTRAARVTDQGDGSYVITIDTPATSRALRVELSVESVELPTNHVVQPPWWLYFLRWF